MIQENLYLQFFCGLPEFTHKPVFDPSLFIDIRKCLGGSEFDEFNKLVISKFEAFNEGQLVESMIESYYEFYGYYPENIF